MPAGAVKPPVMGILTKTLFYSSVVNWIIPARIRHKDKNDVVFIRNTSIEIKEFSSEPLRDRLQDIAFKADFGSNICSARVLGDPCKAIPRLKVDPLTAIIKQEEEQSPRPMDIDVQTSQTLPPQMLVMALQSPTGGDNLIFLFAFHSPLNEIRWIKYQHPLPAYAHHAKRLGKHLAVDPK